MTPLGGQFCQYVVGHFEVGGHALDVVVIFQNLNQAHQFLRAFEIKLCGRCRFPDQLGRFRLAEVCFEIV